MKSKFIILLLFSLLMLSNGCRDLRFYWGWTNKPTDIWWETADTTIATFFYAGEGPYDVHRYEYFVDSKRYTGGKAYRVMDVAVGTKYKVAYSKQFPFERVLLLDTQIFEDEESVDTAIACLRTIFFYKNHCCSNSYFLLSYQYCVNGVNYDVYGSPVPYDEDIYQKYITKKRSWEIRNDAYIIRYWKENPKRSILDLKKPVDTKCEIVKNSCEGGVGE